MLYAGGVCCKTVTLPRIEPVINRQRNFTVEIWEYETKRWEIDNLSCNLLKTLQVNTRAVCCMRAASAAKHALYQLKFEDDWNDDQWMHGRKFLSQKLLSISHNCKAIFFNKEINHATNWNNITLPNYVQCMLDINML